MEFGVNQSLKYKKPFWGNRGGFSPMYFQQKQERNAFRAKTFC